jgi:hypothetical protein
MKERNDDFPLSLALLTLAAVLGFLILGKPLLSGELKWMSVEAFLQRNLTLLITSGVLFVFNLTSIVGGAQRWIGFRKQGSRLKSLRGERSLLTRQLLVRFGLGLIASCLTFIGLTYFNIGEVRWH